MYEKDSFEAQRQELFGAVFLCLRKIANLNFQIVFVVCVNKKEFRDCSSFDTGNLFYNQVLYISEMYL